MQYFLSLVCPVFHQAAGHVVRGNTGSAGSIILPRLIQVSAVFDHCLDGEVAKTT